MPTAEEKTTLLALFITKYKIGFLILIGLFK